MIGPRNSVVAHLRGEPCNAILDDSEWVNSACLYWHELPEVWIDKIHDYVLEDDDTLCDRSGRERPASTGS